MTWLCFCFDFVRPHAWCSCRSIDCWKRWGIRVKLDVQGQRGRKILDTDGPQMVERGGREIRQFSWMSYVYQPLQIKPTEWSK